MALNELTSEKVAVITGATSGIGLATAEALAARGVRLALLARNGELLREVAGSLKSRSEVAWFVCDVRDEVAVRTAIAGTLERFGQIDILINNAGLSLNGEVDGYQLEDWQTVIETNLTGAFLLCREVLPSMKSRRAGQIINISSGAGRNGIRNMAAYCASKFGLIGFTESLGHEVRSYDIRVSVLLPGSVATAFSAVARREVKGSSASGPKDIKDGKREAIGYAMLPDEVASVIISMLAQPSQAWMSEVVLRPLNLDVNR